jgi:hypothetical protein
MDFLNHREGSVVFYQVFLTYSFTVYSNFNVEIGKRLREFEEIGKRLREFEEIEISRQSC